MSTWGKCPAGAAGWWARPLGSPSLELPLSAGGRGHQVHKSWPNSFSDSDGSLDPRPGSGEEPTRLAGGWDSASMESASQGPSGEYLADQRPAPFWFRVSDSPISCPGDFKERISSSGTMSSSEELVDQEGSAGTSAFEQGEGAPDPGSGARGGLVSTCGPTPDLPQ